MTTDLCGDELYGETHNVGHEIERNHLHEAVAYDVPESPVETEREAVLIAGVPDAEKHGRNEGQHHYYHDSLQVDAVSDMRASLCHCIRNIEE